MPVVNLKSEFLFRELNRRYTQQEFEELCFDFGIELDDVTSEYAMAVKEVGAEKAKGMDQSELYRIDIPANRYDLLCAEGIARALRIFLRQAETPAYRVLDTPVEQQLVCVVKPATQQIRAHMVCAVLRDVSLDEASYKSFIDLQDKLHQNICRKRTLASIGTHDLDTIDRTKPIIYDAVPPEAIDFVPLKETRAFKGPELMAHYDNDIRMKKYTPIIRDSPVYPLVTDHAGTVLSLPPVINSEHSKITLNTKNILIEVTCTDRTKGEIVLNTVVAMFSQYCHEPFTVEPVQVKHEATGETVQTPNLAPKQFQTTTAAINKLVGVDLTTQDICSLLTKMSLHPVVKHAEDSSEILDVAVPCTRSDVLHVADIFEDVAIAYGYNNIVERQPSAYTPAAPFPINHLSDLLRRELAQASYIEINNLTLCSHDENFGFLNRVEGKTHDRAVHLSNPATAEYQVIRTSLLPGLLKTLNAHAARTKLPLQIFEVADVVIQTRDANVVKETGARNIRRLAAVYTDKASAFEKVHGVLDRIMRALNLRTVMESAKAGDTRWQFRLQESQDATFLPGRQAEILVDAGNGAKPFCVGHIGILHPSVNRAFKIDTPITVFEMDVEPFL
ncbi:hypothetical protein CXG81DRAFT_13979 [Caulochytrium protostelioides]|uniref:phenylalanine--tRNA ligase n=1 Tax=Caulochytrium protostelioides TaxID=1555241 RepID=A0A4P9X469_9FUNG|nr:hypothetical protein CXG81DRAFT_13979 [Caulochytrium protostelioides]|eukprot:RKO99821.1 hypothetical protein CXG81DRAFT_13979 [Caulochytrium protostelioides]